MDKKCTRSTALREVRDCVYGDFFCTELEDSDPGMFRVKSIKTLPKASR